MCNWLIFKNSHSSVFRGKWHLMELSFIWLFEIEIITLSPFRKTFFILSLTVKEVFNRIWTANKTECVQYQKHIACKWTQDIYRHIIFRLIYIPCLTIVPNHSVFFQSSSKSWIYWLHLYQILPSISWIPLNRALQVKSMAPPPWHEKTLFPSPLLNI